MFGLGMPEFIVICVIALLVFGPKKLPDLMGSLGKGIRQFKKSLDEPEPNAEFSGMPGASDRIGLRLRRAFPLQRLVSGALGF